MTRVVLCLLLLVAVSTGQFKSEHAVVLTDDTIQGAILKGPLLVNFCVNFLGACKEMHPVWEKLAERIHALPGSNVTVATVDVWNNHVSKKRFQVADMPWLLLFQKGEFLHFPNTGLSIDKTDAGLEKLVKFALDGEVVQRGDTGTGPKARGVLRGKIPPIPELPQWFTTHDYVARDGKVYKGASY